MQKLFENWRGYLNENILMDKLNINQSPIQGMGIFAADDIPANTNLGVSQMKLPNDDYEVTTLGKYHNHSSQPTCYNKMIDNKRYLFPYDDLKKGDEITIDYKLQPDLEQPESWWK